MSDSPTAALSATYAAGACVLAPAPSDPPTPPEPSSMRREWLSRLLDLSLRSSLVNMKEGSRAMTLEGLSAAAAVRRLAMGEPFELDPESKVPEQLCRTGRTALSESGTNVLFVVLGAVRWTREGEDGQHVAPLLMVPAEIERSRAAKRYLLRAHLNETRANPALAELMSEEISIDMPDLAPVLAAKPADEAAIIALDALRGALFDVEGWDVEDIAALGAFPFARVALYQDLAAHERDPFRNGVTAALAGEAAFETSPGAEELASCRLSSVGHELPLRADASQLRAIQMAARGESFVLDGPPGTGKSQTIANIVVDGIVHGKSVLVVSEKAAALDVVRKRLAETGLADFCLSLYGNDRPARVLDQLARVIEAAETDEPPQPGGNDPREVVELERELDAYADALARPTSAGISLREAIGRYALARDAEDAVAVDEVTLAYLASQEAIDEAERFIERLGAASDAIGFEFEHPMEDADADELDAVDSAGLRAAAARYADAADELDRACAAVAAGAGMHEPLTGEDVLFCQQAARALAAWRGQEAWIAYADASDLEGMLGRVPAGTPARRVAECVVDAIRSGAGTLDAALDVARATDELDAARAALGSFQHALPESCGEAWADEQRAAACRLADAADDVGAWRTWRKLCAEASERGLASAAEALRSGMTVDEVKASFDKALYAALCGEAISPDTPLGTVSGAVLDKAVEQYRRADAEYRDRERRIVPAYLALHARVTCADPLLAEQIVGLKRVLRSRSRAVSLRFVMAHFRNAVVGLCPCVLATPDAVAQRFGWGPLFDLAIFDEASQIDTAHAVGVLERCRQVIVAGDPQQLPPTSFFERQRQVAEGVTTLEELLLAGGESLLDDCLAAGLARVNLRWHYRSRHESLISFSNRRFYDGRLHTFPSPDDRVSRVRVRRVEGTYDGAGVNRAEAEVIAAYVEDLWRADPETPPNLGVITFNVRQQAVVEEMLAERYAADEGFRAWAESGSEPLFVKNLENVQGDERDVILLSVTYGPDGEGRVSQRFGPVNVRGGERRLNVAFTRARRSLTVFSTMRSDQIDVSFATSEGARVLRDFLAYAEKGTPGLRDADGATGQDGEAEDAIDVTDAFEMGEAGAWADAEAAASADAGDACALPGAAPARDALAASLAQALEREGWKVVPDVGASSFKVDLAVVDPDCPDRYLAGILLDGASYRAARTTRDRDIARDEMLEGLGWRIAHVWAIDCLGGFDRVVRSLNLFLRQCR